MNRFVLGALAFSAASTLGNATETEDWAGLDKELETLRASLAPSSSGSAVGASGFIRSSYLLSNDARGNGAGGSMASGHELAGFSIDNVRLNLSAQVDRFEVFVQLEASDKAQFNDGTNVGFDPSLGATPGTPTVPAGYAPATATRLGNNVPTSRVGTGFDVTVLDAYASWNIEDEFKLTLGQFRAPVTRGALLDEDSLFFLERSANDFFWATRDQGLMVSGQVGPVSYAAGVQNGGMHTPTNPLVGGLIADGGDGAGQEVAYFGRVNVDILGDGPGRVEGALGSPDDLAISAGIAAYHDESFHDSTAVAADVIATFDGIISASAQGMWLDDAYNNSLDEEFVWNVMLTGVIVPDKWEVGMRFEDFDDSFGLPGASGNKASTNQLTFGVNHYINGTHNAKISANYVHVHARDRAVIKETDLFMVGLSLSW